MYPSPFAYQRPSSLQEAITLLSENPDAKILAGGHSLLPAMKLRLAMPGALVDIGRLDELKGISVNGGATIGAATTYDEVADSADLAGAFPVLAEVMHIIGEVKGRSCVLMDDMVDTANTLCEAAAALKAAGALSVMACCTHPVLSGPAVDRIAKSDLDRLLVTNTIPLRPAAKACEKIQQLCIGELLAESIRRIASADSVSSLFMD